MSNETNDYICWMGKSRQSLIDTLKGWKQGNKILIQCEEYDAAYVFTKLTQQTLKTAQMEGLITPQECQALSNKYRLDIWL